MLIKQLADELTSRGYTCEVQEIAKTNGTKTGLIISQGEGDLIAPTIYDDMVSEMLEPEMSVEELADRVIGIINDHPVPAINAEELTSQEFLLANAELAVCNTAWNAEMLKDLPHRNVADLSLYVRVRVSDEGTFKPSLEILEKAGISREEILEAARKNTLEKKWEIRSLQEVMCEMLGMDPSEQEQDNRFLMVSNSERIHGATAICSPEILDRARDILGVSSIYIIPSSLHEILVLPAEAITAEELNAMIQATNAEAVAMEDRLSDHAYKYDGQKLEMVMTQEHEMKRAGRSR